MRTHRLHSPALAVVAAASLFAAGCGGSDEDDVKGAIKDIATAAQDKDYEKVCNGLTDDVRKQFERGARRAGGGDCKKLLERLDKGGAISKEIGDPDDLKFEKVTVKGDKATVKLKDDPEPAELVKEDGEWKVGVGQ